MKCGSQRTAMTLDEIPGRWSYRAVQKRAEARQREIMMEYGKQHIRWSRSLTFNTTTPFIRTPPLFIALKPLSKTMMETLYPSEKRPSADIQGENVPVVGNDQHRSEATIEITPKYSTDRAEKINLEDGGTGANDEKLEDNESGTSPPEEGIVRKAEDEELHCPGFVKIWQRYRLWGHAVIWLLCTAYVHLC